MSKTEPRRISLARNKTLSELEHMLDAIKAHPDSKIGASGISIYNKSASKKMDDITWAIYSITKKEKTEFIREASPPELKNW